MLEISIKCAGNHIAYCPESLKHLDTFMAACDCGVAYLFLFLNGKMLKVKTGSDQEISDLYESLEWDETLTNDNDGTFFYKTVPSMGELATFLNRL